MKKFIGRLLLLFPIQFCVGIIVVLSGHTFGGTFWWTSTVLTGLFISLGLDMLYSKNN